MADDQNFNSMQAQLGLVGGSGGFNPLGIATPAPPPIPFVRHPGEVSQDIVRQTQTQMATTLQTASAMRLGGMGGMAFGGGSGLGMGAIGAFAQQYQQNMAGIQSQQFSPYSAQMMGMMGGMGSGFQSGMMPHPAMMTSPGMGIYRPFMPPPAPSVSPFPQMPMFQTPFSPMPPPPQFQTPMELSNNMAIQAGQRRTAAMFATPGVVARAGADIGLGYMGAGVGASIGARFGPLGAAIGGGLGLAAGVFGSEHFGLGAAAQHITERLNPFRTMAIRGQQMMSASQDWVGGGANLNMMSGRGLSGSGATHLGRLLEDTAFSSRFRRETGGAFSAQDLTKITNVAGQQGLLNDTQSVEQIHERVKSVAKSLVSFMKIANEPSVVEALRSMGRMRQMGLSVGETMDMAMEARMYSKMAGTSVKGIMESGGMPGAMIYQQQGLSAGLGMRMGIGAMGMAHAAVAGGTFSPQRLAMLGGVQGVAQHEMESSAAFLKQPMMAAAMSTMGRGGEFGMDGRAIRDMARGKMDINQMATRGVDNMLDAVRKQGVGAIGMFQVQGTEIQDNLGRLLGPQGVQAAKMQQIMQTMKFMGLDKNPGGFATAALSMGMTNDQVKSLMSQANSPGYFQNLQRQASVQKMELRGLAAEEFERNKPDFLDRVRSHFGGFQGLRDAYAGMRNFGEGVTNFFSDRQARASAQERGQVILDTPDTLLGNDRTIRNMRAMTDPEGAARAMRELGAKRRTVGSGVSRGYTDFRDNVRGGNADDVAQLRESQGGLASVFGGGFLEELYRLNAAGLTGTSGGLSTEAENRAATKDMAAGSSMWQAAQSEGVDAWKSRLSSTAKGAGVKDAAMKKLVANVTMKLAAKARDNKNLILPDGQMGGAEAGSVIEEEARALGIKLDKEGIASVGALAGKTAGTLSGNDSAFRPKDFVNVKSDKEFKDNLLNQQDALTSAMFGDEGIDLLRGTRNNRARIVQQLFSEQKNAKAGVLAAVLSAGAKKGASKEAQRKAAEIMASADQEDIAQAMELQKGLKDKLPELENMGDRFIATGGSLDEMYAGGEGAREMALSAERQASERVGRRALFGESADMEGSTEDILKGGNISGMRDRMKDIAKRYRAAKMRGEDTSDIVKEADSAILLTGATSGKEVAGGTMSVTDAAATAVSDMAADAEGAVSGAFPAAVDTFSDASRAMLRAAELLNRSGSRTTLATGDATGSGIS